MTRDERQEIIVNKWINNKCFGGLVAVTGFGKTRASIIAIRKTNPIKTFIIVPTIDLKKQWLKSLKEQKVKAEVFVVNSVYKKNLECDLLILDESHMVGSAEQFSLCWKNAKFNKLLWLSATIERKDGFEKELLKIAPIIDTVTFEEALSNGWISNYKIYNVGLSFNFNDNQKYQYIEDSLNDVYAKVAELTKGNVDDVKRNMFDLARKFLANKENKQLLLLGLRYNKLINLRKSLLYDNESKRNKTLWFLKESKLNDKQTIIFSQSQEFADYIYSEFKEQTEVIHSGMKDGERNSALKRFLDGRTKKRILSTVKAFNQGIDIPTLSLGVNVAYTSSKIEMTQKLGRLCRLDGDKEAILINLYMKNTQEVFWLKNGLYDFDKSKIIWVND